MKIEIIGDKGWRIVLPADEYVSHGIEDVAKLKQQYMKIQEEKFDREINRIVIEGLKFKQNINMK